MINFDQDNQKDAQRDIVLQLQDELAKQKAESESEVIQGLNRTSANEIIQLRQTIDLLRDELEKTALNSEEAVQRSVAAVTDEIKSLRETIVNLRAALDEKDHEKNVAVQKVTQGLSGEIVQLKKTVSSLRNELEIHKADARTKFKELKSKTKKK